MSVSLTATITFAALAVAAAPAAAQPVLAPLKPCYVSVNTAPKEYDTEFAAITGSGFTPNALVDVAVQDGERFAGVLVGPDGNLTPGEVRVPVAKTGSRPFTVTATEQNNPAQTVTVASRVTDLAVRVTPREARPSSRVRFSGQGFTDLTQPVYAHYSRGGKVRRTVQLVKRPTGPCGAFRVRRKQFPFRPATGGWTIQIDQRKRLADDPPYVQVEIDVRRAG